MHILRIVSNILFALCCFAGSAHVMRHGTFYLRDRWNPGTGSYFTGMSLYFLALSLFFFGALAAAVAVAWIRGDTPLPDRHAMQPHPSYKGQIIVRYWYLVAPVLGLLLGAFLMAHKGPQPPAGNSHWGDTNGATAD